MAGVRLASMLMLILALTGQTAAAQTRSDIEAITLDRVVVEATRLRNVSAFDTPARWVTMSAQSRPCSIMPMMPPT